MHLTDLTEDDARAIARWRYPAPYDCYDYPAWERMARERWAICDAVARRDQFLALRSGDAAPPDPSPPDLAGYVRFRPAPDSLMIHLGLRPDLCGRGLGGPFLEMVVAESLRRAGAGPVSLQVRRFNLRASTVYRRVGFRLVGDASGSDPQDLLTMVLSSG